MREDEGTGTMLWYKAWHESRVRFLISALVLIGICAVVVLLQQPFRAQLHTRETPLNTYAGYIYLRIYGGFARGTFLLLALVLGLGGLQREKAHGTAGFTLALPVSRFRHLAVRAAVGLLQVAALSLLPLALVPGLSPFAGEYYPWRQSLQFSLLWIVVGSAVFAAAFLASAVFANEYSALAVSLVAFLMYPLATHFSPLRRYPLNIHYIMNGIGMPYFDPRTDLLAGPMPWTILSVAAMVAMIFIASATVITRKQDFS
jgi:ABC-2 type transport system permease protein